MSDDVSVTSSTAAAVGDDDGEGDDDDADCDQSEAGRPRDGEHVPGALLRGLRLARAGVDPRRVYGEIVRQKV